MALVAVLWNLSASAPNRALMREHGILRVLATLLPEEGPMQRETLGATNNFALDGSLPPLVPRLPPLTCTCAQMRT